MASKLPLRYLRHRQVHGPKAPPTTEQSQYLPIMVKEYTALCIYLRFGRVDTSCVDRYFEMANSPLLCTHHCHGLCARLHCYAPILSTTKNIMSACGVIFWPGSLLIFTYKQHDMIIYYLNQLLRGEWPQHQKVRVLFNISYLIRSQISLALKWIGSLSPNLSLFNRHQHIIIYYPLQSEAEWLYFYSTMGVYSSNFKSLTHWLVDIITWSVQYL